MVVSLKVWMSWALVCHTAPGTFDASISPPPRGVVATTSKVGSWIVSARAVAAAAATSATPIGQQRQAVKRVTRSHLPCAIFVIARYSLLKESWAGSPGG